LNQQRKQKKIKLHSEKTHTSSLKKFRLQQALKVMTEILKKKTQTHTPPQAEGVHTQGIWLKKSLKENSTPQVSHQARPMLTTYTNLPSWLKDPKSYEKAMASPERKQWEKDMKEEMTPLKSNEPGN
jgi:hypothetical protein